MKFPALGYTLIELVVVIAIIAILVVFAYATIGSLQEDQLLKSSSQNIISFVRLAQSNATARLKCTISNVDKEGANWVVEFRDQTTLELKCYSPDDVTLVSLVKSINLPTNITVDSIATTPPCSSPNLPVTLTFRPLSGSIAFGDSASPSCITGSNMTVVVKNTRINCQSNCSNPCNESSQCIKIDTGGAVDVN